MGKMTELVRTARRYIGYDYRHFTKQFGGGVWAWCAAFVSTVGQESGNAEIIPWSTSCNEQIRQFKNMGCWLGKTKDIQVGDIIYYDWDFKNEPLPADHVGIVVEIKGSKITVIEGNKGDLPNDCTTVAFREITADYKYIFGIARPKYDSGEAAAVPDEIVSVKVRQLEMGCKGRDVESLQSILIAKGFSCGTYGTDGDFGGKTLDAVKGFQAERKIEVDGIVGPETWGELLKK